MNSKNLSRRDFLKGALAGTAAAALTSVSGISAFAEEKGIYTPGTYSATAQGMGTVTVTMTFDANSITDVVVDVSEETPTIGGLYGEQLAEAIKAAQGAEIDAVSGASITSAAAKRPPKPASLRRRAPPLKSALPRRPATMKFRLS